MKFTLLGFQVSIVSKRLIDRVETLSKTYLARTGGDRFGTKISRIKAYRELTSSGLKEAKDWVEANFMD